MNIEKAHYFNGHSVNFDVTQDYKWIKYKINLGYNHSKLKIVKALTTVFDIGLLDAKNICESEEWHEINDVNIAIKLFNNLGSDVINFKALPLENYKQKSDEVKLEHAEKWFKTLSKKEKKYVDILISQYIPTAG